MKTFFTVAKKKLLALVNRCFPISLYIKIKYNVSYKSCNKIQAATLIDIVPAEICAQYHTHIFLNSQCNSKRLLINSTLVFPTPKRRYHNVP